MSTADFELHHAWIIEQWQAKTASAAADQATLKSAFDWRLDQVTALYRESEWTPEEINAWFGELVA